MRGRLVGAALGIALALVGGLRAWQESHAPAVPPAPLPARPVVAVPAAGPRPTPPQPAMPTVTPPAPILPAPADPPSPTPWPPAPAPTPAFRVGLQVGHWQIGGLPDSLAALQYQTGTEAAGRTELDVNMDVARRTAGLVVVDLLPATVPNGYRADAFVAIHADGNWIRPVRGYKIAPPYRSGVAWADAVLAGQLDTAYRAATGLPRDPEVTDNMRGYYAINGWMGDESRISDQTPGAVIETGFMTSAADRAVLFDQPQQVATGLATGILAFLQTAAATDATQRRAAAVAAGAPTGCSVIVQLDETPVRAAPDPEAAVVTWVNRGTVLAYLDGTARPRGPFTLAAGRQLVVQTGYYRVAPPGGGPPAYINHAPVIVQLPTP